MEKYKTNVHTMKRKLLFLSYITFCLLLMPTICVHADENNIIKVQNGSINTRQIGDSGPSLVFETGYGDAIVSDTNEDTWNGIQDYAANYAKTISYDRFGLGKSSDIGNMPSLTVEQRQTIFNGGSIKYDKNNFNGQYKTARDKAINLHNVLEEAKVKKPYVLVIHSIGSFTAIEFAKMYKNDLAGIVMLDGTFPDINKDLYPWAKENMPDLANNYASQFTNADGNLDEVLISGLQCEKDIKSLKNIPILYLESSENELGAGVYQLWDKGVNNMLSNWRFAEKVVVPNSQHYVHKSNPEFVNNEIKNFVHKLGLI